MSTVLAEAIRRGTVTEEDTSIIFYDLSRLSARIRELVETFPPTTLHAIAAKANPLITVLQKINALGTGIEVASAGELQLAVQAGFPPERIVFDSPVKTIGELRQALNLGVRINADSFAELERIDSLLQSRPARSAIGVRINPQVGTGRILFTSVAGEYSKFAIPLRDQQEQLLTAFTKYPWLHGVHVHIGSQGCDVGLLADGVACIVEFVRRVSAQTLPVEITAIDIGGGLPVRYTPDDPHVSMAEYRKRLMSKCPDLFDGRYQLITEFGRYVHANNGWVASRVEYVKPGTARETIMTHVGADLLLRKCYQPEIWNHEMAVADTRGTIKTGEGRRYTVAGPLCFAGDIIAADIELPRVKPGDYLLIRDIGAYTFSMWSRYNSRQIPLILGYREPGGTFEVLKRRESLEDLQKFWT